MSDGSDTLARAMTWGFHVKHLSEAHILLARRLLLEAGLGAEVLPVKALLQYLDGIMESNSKLNLTRITSPEAAIRLHVVDSLIALPEILAAPPGTLLDIGTGGGFPGVPLCISANRDGVLLDSVGKKARAVNHVLLSMGYTQGIVALPERAEDHAMHHRSGYAVVTARAVSELPALVELSAPLLVEGGRLVALKGAPEPEELRRARQVAALVGMVETSTRHITLPDGDEKRCIVVYERRGKPITRLPRRPGAAQNAPLA